LKARDAKGPSSDGDGDGDGAPLIAHTLRAQAQAQAQASHRADTETYVTCFSSKDHGAIPFDTTQVTSAANYSNPQPGDPCHPLARGAHAPAVAFALRGREGGAMPEVEGYGDQIGALRAASGGSSRDYVAFGGDVARTLSRRYDGSPCDDRGPDIVAAASAVRRLTPTECERLQGFPDGYTLIPWRGKPADQCPDGPRYKALGNSMAVPCMAWIGQRIAMVEAIQSQRKAA
jgi:DNA (cytosine-5)-methyltransferase 1